MSKNNSRKRRATTATAPPKSTRGQEPEFRLRPRRPRRVHQPGMAWSVALRTVFRYARGSGSARKLGLSKRRVRPGRAFNQRCAVRVAYSPNKVRGQWRAHGVYIARESATHKPTQQGFDGRASSVNVATALDDWQKSGDERLWKLIISPEFGERLDLERMARDVMNRVERDLSTSLEWVAVSHFNTQHPHVHLVVRGRREDGSPLLLPRDYVRHGLRHIAEDACTLQLGPRTELDAIAAEEREVGELRVTGLDRALQRYASDIDTGDARFFHIRIQDRTQVRAALHEQHLAGRLVALQKMGLAEPTGQGAWQVRRDFETVLKAMQRTTDRQKTLAASGALVSDERLRLNVLDFRRLREAEGRVLMHGEDENAFSGGRHYLLLEGTDAQIHLIYYTPEMEEARSRGKLNTNSFVRISKQYAEGQPVLQINNFGDAEMLLRNKRFLADASQQLLKRGIIPQDEGWAGWLGSYQRAVRDAALTRTAERARDRSFDR